MTSIPTAVARLATRGTDPGPLRPTRLAQWMVGVWAAACSSAFAQQSDQHEAVVTELAAVVVTATRTEQSIDDTTTTVTTLPAERIKRSMSNDIQDLLRDEAGVSVRALPNRSSAALYGTGRAGNEGINVRGLEGNQVLLQTDGVRLPMSYASGPFASGRGDYIDVEAYKRVEIVRGPSSTQFGSDGLSGAVSFLTKDPEDLLTLGKDFQTGLKVGYASVDRSWSVVPSFAARGETFEGMVLASVRRGRESKTSGDVDAPNNTRTVPNPQDTSSDYLLAKLVFKAGPAHRFKLTAETLDRDVDTDVYTLFGDPFYPTTVDVDARENITRDVIKLDYDYLAPQGRWFQRASASLYGQRAKNKQWGYERRTNTTAWNERTRDTQYAEDTVGASVQFESNFGEAVTHRLVYGIDASVAEVSSLKDGAQYLNGVKVTSGSSAFVQNKSFPDTDYTLAGVFLQDEIVLGSIALVPGLRYDTFKLEPKPDALYTINNSTPPSTLDAGEWSPKFGALWKIAPLFNVYGQYAHGFRAPTPSQVNGGVTNLSASQPYYSIGNPDLKPEESNSIELGLRGRTPTLRYSAAVFHGKYENFIAANTKVSGSGTASDPTVFQSINLSKVEISGFEARGEWVFARDWNAQIAYAYARGDEDDAGVKTPLETIDPDKLVLGLRYAKDQAWGGQLNLTLVKRKDRNPDPDTTYTPGGYGVTDITAWYQLRKGLTLHAGVFNVFDKKYHLWADVRGFSMTSATIDAYSQPGRNASIALRAEF